MVGDKLVYAQYAGHVVSAWDGKTNTELWKQDGCGPSAVVPMGDHFGVTCYDNGKLEVISPAGETARQETSDQAPINC